MQRYTHLLGIPDEMKKWTREYIVWLHTPLIENMPASAPIYMINYEAKDYPREQCIMFNSGPKRGLCQCYSQQSTKMRSVDAQTCKHIIYEGRAFDPRIEPRRGENSQAESDSRSEQALKFSYPMQVQTENPSILPRRYGVPQSHPLQRG